MLTTHARISGVDAVDPGILFAPEIMLPAQFDVLRQAGAARVPEHRLMLAVLEDAVHQYQLGCDLPPGRASRAFRDVETWFASETTASPFSFVTICQVLGLEPDYLRSGLRRWRTERAADPRPGPRTIPFRIRRVSGSRHHVTIRRRRSGQRAAEGG